MLQGRVVPLLQQAVLLHEVVEMFVESVSVGLGANLADPGTRQAKTCIHDVTGLESSPVKVLNVDVHEYSVQASQNFAAYLLEIFRERDIISQRKNIFILKIFISLLSYHVDHVSNTNDVPYHFAGIGRLVRVPQV